jgi:hypothetical protein
MPLGISAAVLSVLARRRRASSAVPPLPRSLGSLGRWVENWVELLLLRRTDAGPEEEVLLVWLDAHRREFALDLDETELAFPGFSFGLDEFRFPTFSSEGVDCELLSFHEFGLEEDEAVNGLRVGSASLSDGFSLSTTETDVRIAVVGLVILVEKEASENVRIRNKLDLQRDEDKTNVELRNDAFSFAENTTVFPVRVDRLGHATENAGSGDAGGTGVGWEEVWRDVVREEGFHIRKGGKASDVLGKEKIESQTCPSGTSRVERQIVHTVCSVGNLSSVHFSMSAMTSSNSSSLMTGTISSLSLPLPFRLVRPASDALPFVLSPRAMRLLFLSHSSSRSSRV